MSRDSNEIKSILISGLTGLSMFAIAAIPILRMGPLDAARTGYNFTYGDMPVLKQELTNYCREGIKRDNPDLTNEQIESRLRGELKYVFDGPIDPNRASIEELWDTSENHARSAWDRFVWANLR